MPDLVRSWQDNFSNSFGVAGSELGSQTPDRSGLVVGGVVDATNVFRRLPIGTSSSGTAVLVDLIAAENIVIDAGTINTGTIQNLVSGTINAVAAGTITAGTLTNLVSGTINALAAGTITGGTLTNLVSGTVNALAAGTITGGTLQNLVSGTINALAAGTITIGTVVGLEASGIAQTGNPVLSGGVYNHAQNLTAGQVGVVMMDQYGDVVVSPRNNSIAQSDGFGNSINEWRAPDTSSVFTSKLPLLFNGATWDRNRNNNDVGGGTVFASAARTGTTNSTDQTNYNWRGARFFLDITASNGISPTLDVKIQTKDPVSAAYIDLPGGNFVQKGTTGTDDLTIYPGIAETATETVSDVLSRTWRAVAAVTVGTFTFSLGASYIV